MKFVLVDDHKNFLDLAQEVVSRDGHETIAVSDPQIAYETILASQPQCVLLDIMMPGIDGLDLCRRLREEAEIDRLKIIMVTGRGYDFDRRRALELGADGFITKPINPELFMSEVYRIISDDITLTFWGVRGTLPLPGPNSLRYGGNTSCASLSLPRERFFIFDAGSGIKTLSDSLTARAAERVEASIFISHPHWDHINALPYFAPLYQQGNHFDIYGADHADISLGDLVSAQMDNVYFPVTVREFGANVVFHGIGEGTHEINGVTVRSMFLSHPGNCLGFRVEFDGRAICYATDNELFPRGSERHNPDYRNQFVEFVADCDALITDCCYTADEYKTKEGWGHSAVEEVVEIAHEANVRNLFLYHHEPDQTDADIERKFEISQALLEGSRSATRCIAPAEGDVFTF